MSDDDFWAGAYGVTVGVVVIVGYWLNGPAGAWYGFLGVMVLSVVTFVLFVLGVILVNVHDAGGDPVAALGIMIIIGAVVLLLVVSGWVLALGVGLGLLVGLWQWRRLVAVRLAHAEE